MQTKLTLRIEEAAIEAAKAWARQRGVSLSATVEQFFERLSSEVPAVPLTPWTQRLLGGGIGSNPPAESSDDRVREGYVDHAEAKYR
ncbi:MAG: hypothetical protein HZB55_02950 [Deltaproteobacteria bacterium]|nr:hypothetical protein [Deltaproteobacteria bacterium]